GSAEPHREGFKSRCRSFDRTTIHHCVHECVSVYISKLFHYLAVNCLVPFNFLYSSNFIQVLFRRIEIFLRTCLFAKSVSKL
ncbi:unnamed protein product, partial [Musa textilis]